MIKQISIVKTKTCHIGGASISVCLYTVPLLTICYIVMLLYPIGHPSFTFNAEILVHIIPALRPIVVPYMLLNDLRHSMQQLYTHVQTSVHLHGTCTSGAYILTV